MISPPVSPVQYPQFTQITHTMRENWYNHPNHRERMRNRRRLSAAVFGRNLSTQQVRQVIDVFILRDVFNI